MTPKTSAAGGVGAQHAGGAAPGRGAGKGGSPLGIILCQPGVQGGRAQGGGGA